MFINHLFHGIAFACWIVELVLLFFVGVVLSCASCSLVALYSTLDFPQSLFYFVPFYFVPIVFLFHFVSQEINSHSQAGSTKARYYKLATFSRQHWEILAPAHQLAKPGHGGPFVANRDVKSSC